MAVDPSGSALADMLAEGGEGPVVMLNLLRFTPEGRSSYEEYSRRAAPFLRKYGAELLYAGDGSTPLVADDDGGWDAILLVRYPDRKTFGRMVADPEYQKITHLRSEALSEAVLQPTRPWGSRRDP